MPRFLKARSLFRLRFIFYLHYGRPSALLRRVKSGASPRLQRFCALLFSFAVLPAQAAVPFDSASVSKIENVVSVGERESGQKAAAQLQQAINANNFVVTEDKGRAELTFPDGSLARVGQNTVFTFDSARTLELKKGAMLFYVPTKSAGTTIKTPALTAAITGTVGLVAENLIAVLIGEITLPDGTVVHENEAVEFVNGAYRVFAFDRSSVRDGYLVQMGPLPDDPFALSEELFGSDIPRELLRLIERGEITQVDPRIRIRKPTPQKAEEPEEEKRKRKSEFDPYQGGTGGNGGNQL